MSGLSYIGQIISTNPIPNADNIVSAVVDCGRGGKWRGVVSKNTKAGDMVQVFLMDALVPKLPELMFMEKHDWRVKMARFRGSPSEVLITNILDHVLDHAFEIGSDVTTISGVTKYEKPIPPEMAKAALQGFPSFIPKTEQLLYQQAGELTTALNGKPYVSTQKVDGVSCTAYRYHGHFGGCSRTWELKPNSNNIYWQMIKKFGLDHTTPEGFAVQFEIYGPGAFARGNPTGAAEPSIAVFDVYDIEKHAYLSWYDVGEYCYKYDLPAVPNIMFGLSWQEPEDYQVLAKTRPEFFSCYAGSREQEGVVIRPTYDAEQVLGYERNSFKIINIEYQG